MKPGKDLLPAHRNESGLMEKHPLQHLGFLEGFDPEQTPEEFKAFMIYRKLPPGTERVKPVCG